MSGAPLMACVINVSEGRDPAVVAALRRAGGAAVLDVHTDGHHHRSVLTLGGPLDAVTAAAHAVCREAVGSVDLRPHRGAHPRMGAVDVVPFVHLAWRRNRVGDASPGPAVAERDRLARWAGRTLGLPCFRYGTDGPALPEVRASAWVTRMPDTGPPIRHPTAGAACVGARPLLVAYNLWLETRDLDRARAAAAAVRSPLLRTLGLAVGRRVQVSCNLVAPHEVGPADAWDAVDRHERVAGAELVGLAPATLLEWAPRSRWADLDLHPSSTIEARLEEAGLDGGRR